MAWSINNEKSSIKQAISSFQEYIPGSIDGPVASVGNDPLVKRIVRIVQVPLATSVPRDSLLGVSICVIRFVSAPNLVVVIVEACPVLNTIWLAAGQQRCGGKEHDHQ